MKFCLFPLSGVFFPHHSYLLLLCMFNIILFVILLAAEMFVIHHSPLISWTNTCFAFPGWYYAINNCFLVHFPANFSMLFTLWTIFPQPDNKKQAEPN